MKSKLWHILLKKHISSSFQMLCKARQPLPKWAEVSEGSIGHNFNT